MNEERRAQSDFEREIKLPTDESENRRREESMISNSRALAAAWTKRRSRSTVQKSAVATKPGRDRGRSRPSSDRHPYFVFSGLIFALFRAYRAGARGRLARASSGPIPSFVCLLRSTLAGGSNARRGTAARVEAGATPEWGRCQAETSGVSAASGETPRFTIEVIHRPRSHPASKNKAKFPNVITCDIQPSLSPCILEVPCSIDAVTLLHKSFIVPEVAPSIQELAQAPVIRDLEPSLSPCILKVP
ncbi:hypothetical protein NL676_000171 [Syzygium grande]|nr:hypothetical protein NL676_000171 [Syzygium grande]